MRNRAARRQAARMLARHPGAPEVRRLDATTPPPKDESGGIVLANPVSEHYGPFIFANALHCEAVVEADVAKGQHLVLCGAGPSLRDEAAAWCPQADQLWGCNSAVTWLLDNGYAPTHALTVDQTAYMCAEWASTPDVEYLLASTVHPHLGELLRGRGRRIRYFHNFVGIARRPVRYTLCHDCGAVLPMPEGVEPDEATRACAHARSETRTEAYEDWLYLALYPGTIRAGSGLNTVTRAIDVALFMGFETISVLGADCCLRVKSPRPADAAVGTPSYLAWLRNEVEMHADGGSALASDATAITMTGEIDGRLFLTKPDMAITAGWLTLMERKLKGRVRLVGDGMPQALRGKSAAWIAEHMPSLTTSDGKPIHVTVEE